MANARDFPKPPPLYSIRLAQPEDIDRMAFVGIAGFRFTQIFQFERPYYEKYPQDTFQSFQELWHGLICDPDVVTLVAEDEYDDREDSHDPLVRASMFFGEKQPQGRVIVGIASWTYEKGSKRHGQFENINKHQNGISGLLWGMLARRKLPSLRRDEIADRVRRVDEAVDAANKKYFEGCNLLTKIVVHPAYWRRGHGTVLLSWGKRLADMDHVNQGTLPSRMGSKLAFGEGFEHIDDVHVEGDEKNPEGIDLGVGIYRFKTRPREAQVDVLY